MNIGNKIKQLRLKAGLTQEQLAMNLGISAQSVSKWETAVTMPDISLLPLLSSLLGVTIDEIFDLTRDQKLQSYLRRSTATFRGNKQTSLLLSRGVLGVHPYTLYHEASPGLQLTQGCAHSSKSRHYLTMLFSIR